MDLKSIDSEDILTQKERVLISIGYGIFGAFFLIIGLFLGLLHVAERSIVGAIVVLIFLLLGFYFAIVSPISILTGHKTPKWINKRKLTEDEKSNEDRSFGYWGVGLSLFSTFIPFLSFGTIIMGLYAWNKRGQKTLGIITILISFIGLYVTMSTIFTIIESFP